jgi:hypothetical protein
MGQGEVIIFINMVGGFYETELAGEERGPELEPKVARHSPSSFIPYS